MEDTQIKTQTPKLSKNDRYFFCAQSLIATLNLLATYVKNNVKVTLCNGRHIRCTTLT